MAINVASVGALASLGLSINSDGALEASANLDKLGAASERTEKRVNASSSNISRSLMRMQAAARQQEADAFGSRLATQLAQAEAETMKLQRGLDGITAARRRMQAAADQKGADAMASQIALLDPFQKGIAGVSRTSDEARLNVGRLGNQFGSLASQMAGVHPVIANVLGVLGNFAIGSLVMTGVLAGLAAVAAAWTVVTGASRSARAATDKLVQSLLGMEKARNPAREYAKDMVALKNRLVEVEDQAARTGTVFGRLSLFLAAIKNPAFWTGGGMKGFLADLEKQAANIRTAIGERRTGEQDRLEDEARPRRERAEDLAFQNAERVRLAQQELDLLRLTGGELEDQITINKVLNEIERARHDLRNEDAATINAAVESIREAGNIELETNATRRHQEYLKDITAIWTDGIAGIANSGLDSFKGMFEGILDMFSKTMALMEKNGKQGTFGHKVLGLGSIAIGGGLAGFQFGQSNYSTARSGAQNYGMGALGGAASGAMAGAMAGSVIPGVGTAVGAAVGGLTGFIGGILGTGSAARAAAREMRELQKQLKTAMKDLRATAAGDTLGQALAQIEAQFAALKKQTEDAYKGRSNEAQRNALLREQAGIQATLMQQARDDHALRQQEISQDLAIRAARSAGRTAEAEEMTFAIQQSREMATAVREHWTEEQKATLAMAHAAEAEQRRADIAREYTRAVEDLNFRLAVANGLTDEQAAEIQATTAAQREYQDAVRAGRDEAYLATVQQVHLAEAYKRSSDRIKGTIAELAQTIAGLEGFRDSLLLGATSTLSPEAQLAEARRQYEQVLNAAKQGDQSAAGRLPGVAQTMLDFSRQVNATGGMYAADFTRVLGDTKGLIDIFSVQKSIAERQLEELTRIRDEAQRIEDNTRQSIPEPSDTRPSIPWPPDEIPGGIPDSTERRRQHDEELGELRLVREEIAALVRVQMSGNQQLVQGVDSVRTAVDENTTATRRGLEQVTIS